ncbi:hypothetical protein CJO69_28670 [Burkholderia ubonensis]|nr:hypothetical protein CJO69_28670 [Burkholderia ubonensis]
MNKWDSRFCELAKFVSEWSKDPNAKVGAVVFANRGGDVSIGYNGFPMGVEDSAHVLGRAVGSSKSPTTTNWSATFPGTHGSTRNRLRLLSGCSRRMPWTAGDTNCQIRVTRGSTQALRSYSQTAGCGR